MNIRGDGELTSHPTEQWKKQFSGVYALLLTPFMRNKEIDWEIYEQYVDWQLSNQPQGLFAVCGSSEMEQLTPDERYELARRAVRRANKIPVLATGNVSAIIEEHEVEILRMAETGVAGIVLIPPGNLGEDQTKLEEYFAKLADISPVPLFLYECPLAAPRHIDSQVYKRLVELHGIVGIKDTTCTNEGINAKITGAPGGLVFQANTPYMADALLHGAAGVMSTTTSAAVDIVLELWESVRSDDAVKTADVHELLVFLDGVLGKGYPVTAKHLVSLRGVPMLTESRKGKSMNASAAKGIEIWLKAAEKHLLKSN